MRLLFIRHGQTPYNVTGALDTASPGADLTPLGQAQAQAIPSALAGEGVCGIFASTAVRTQQTAAPLMRSCGIDTRVLDGLVEISAGELELRADAEAVQLYISCLGSWLRGDLDRTVPGGTTGHDFYARYDAAVRAVAAEHGPDDSVAVFSHGGAIRVYAALAAGLDPGISTELRILNTGLCVLEGSPETGWDLTRWSGEPLGGPQLADLQAHDVTGESTDEVMQER